MNKAMYKLLVTTSMALALLSVPAFAAVSSQEAGELGKSLTPLGAPMKGNGDTIPDWHGGLTLEDAPEGYDTPGQHHVDPFADEKASLTINNDNKELYEDKLPKGVQALMEKYPETFVVKVYPSHRTTAAPKRVYENTKKNATRAELGETSVSGAYGGIPFPILHGNNEEKARQAIWNHILRWRGVYIVRSASEVAVKRSGKYSLVTAQQEGYFPYYDSELSEKDWGNVIFYYLSFITAPARLAGGAVLVHETMDQRKNQRQAWGYNAGTRRVQRSPNIAYDSPIAASDGLRTADDTDLYNGAPDKYDWKLVHDEPVEMYIPYNNYRLTSPELSYDDVLQQGHVSAEHSRWELQRVWVVQADLKDTEKHIYHKRVFYIDADSWQIAAVDQYDRRGKLWRVSLSYIKNYYEVPTQWTGLDVFHDLRIGRYHVQLLMNEEKHSLDFNQAVPDEKYFSPASLRRRGR